LKRLIILSDQGDITLSAIRWLADLGIPWCQIARDGTILATSSTQGTDYPALRRSQALAADSPTGPEVARFLITRKVKGQRAALAQVDDSAAAVEFLTRALDELAAATTVRRVLQLEAAAAVEYWAACSSVPIRFATSDWNRVPTHWQTLGTRTSPISGNTRFAANPIAALVNYAYSILEAETRIAVCAVGLDPGIAVMHRDERNRDSLVSDIMEATRGSVDQHVLTMLRERVFRIGEFVETRRGVCRLVPPLTHSIAEAALVWADEIAPIVEHVRDILGATIDTKYTPTTPLTHTKHRDAQATVKARNANGALTARATSQRPASSIHPTCVECGGPLARGRNQRCPACWERQPGQDAATRARRGRAISAKRAELERWRRDHPGAVPDETFFRAEILPKLAGLKLSEIQSALSCAKSTASMIRAGERIPALRHFEPLMALVSMP
jgi:CRISPR-associated endonuclease Cas1